MQFDDFDKKIKEAAEHHHPAYEEKAWNKMEKLLDKHLPNEKDDKRRILFLLFLFLLTGAGIYLAISKPWHSKINLTQKISTSLSKSPEDSSAASNKDIKDNPVKNTSSAQTNKAAPAGTGTKSKINTELTDNKLKSTDENSILKPSAKIKNNSTLSLDKKVIAVPQKLDIIKNVSEKTNSLSVKKSVKETLNDKDPIADNSVANKTRNSSTIASPQKNIIENNTKNTDPDNIIPADKPGIDNTAVNIQTPGLTIKNVDSASQKKPNAALVTKVENEKQNTELPKKENVKPGRQKKSSFAITLTGAPDLSTVGLTNIGKVKLSYGAGLSYSLNRFKLRSGFYVSRKVYTASPDEYHPPQHNWIYYVDLNKIDADCKVYEIPVTLSYNFSQSKTHNWFASTGLSTYLMKRETYDYYYKNPVTQQPDYKTSTFNDVNKHFFTILDLSAGYERKLNKSLSLIVEPYIKIPLDGIGVGNLKLNSAGIAITLSIKPFAGKK